MTHVISLGGSIIAPGGGSNPATTTPADIARIVDIPFLRDFFALVHAYLGGNRGARLVLVTGGGAPARAYQNAYREAAPASEYAAEEADWLGVAATKLNAQLIKALAGSLCPQDVVTDPSRPGIFAGRVLVASGWKPGFSSDYDAVLLAETFGADTVINLSNIEKVYTADPKKNPKAKPIDKISWKDFRKMVGDTWTPGANVPFDPVASREAESAGIRVICAAGKKLGNLRAILEGRDFVGTTIG